MGQKKNKSPASRTQSKTFTLELYLDWTFLTNILAHIQKQRYWLILHDKDKFDDGTDKKPHIHVVVEYGNKRDLSSVKAEYKMLGMEERFVDTCNKRAMIRYLIHKDNPEKYQYDKSKVDTNDPRALEEALTDILDQSAQLHMLMDWIDEQPYNIRQSDLNRFALSHQLQGTMQRYWTSMIRPMVQEHNLEAPCREDAEYKKQVKQYEEAMSKMGIERVTEVTELPQLNAEKKVGLNTSRVTVKKLNMLTGEYDDETSYFEDDEVLVANGLKEDR